MSDTVDLGFISVRLDSIGKDNADVRRRVIIMGDQIEEFSKRLEDFDKHLEGIDRRIGFVDRRMHTLETRLDAMVDRQSNMERDIAQVLLMLRRMETK